MLLRYIRALHNTFPCHVHTRTVRRTQPTADRPHRTPLGVQTHLDGNSFSGKIISVMHHLLVELSQIRYGAWRLKYILWLFLILIVFHFMICPTFIFNYHLHIENEHCRRCESYIVGKQPMDICGFLTFQQGQQYAIPKLSYQKNTTDYSCMTQGVITYHITTQI